MNGATPLSGFEWASLLAMGGVMWAGLLYFVKRWMAGVDDGLKGESMARNGGLDSLRSSLNKLDHDFRRFELEVTRDYVARAHLVEALGPLTERIEGFRDDIKELFALVHTKEDRRGGG